MHNYIGRFAPSPTGPLHIGSLITALASFLDARSQHGKWLVRIDDIDPLREQAGVDRDILKSLQAHGLQWDDDVVYQSQRIDLYQHAVKKLLNKQRAFYCSCSRKDLDATLGFYTGTCRACHQPPNQPYAIRIRVDGELPTVNDRWQGSFKSSHNEGDFVIWRKEGYVAYQLAAAIDDDAQNISHVVRGSDLLDSTPKQIYLQQQMNLSTPIYGHLPIICNTQGQKLSKQTFAKALDNSEALANLRFALDFLQQPENTATSVGQCISQAVAQWQPALIPRQMAIVGAGHARD
jgi:glutamyl-Q tRNA(Asp) synthetase